MNKRQPQLTVIENSEEAALRAYFRRLYMVEKYLLQIMLENDVQLQYKLLHSETPRLYQGRIRFNGGIALGFNPYSQLPSVFYTPLGAVDLSKGFATHENAADDVARTLYYSLGLSELEPVPSIVPGVYQRVFAITRDPYGNPLPRASLLLHETASADPGLADYIDSPEAAMMLWDRVRLHEEPSAREQVLLSLPRHNTHLQAVA